MILYCFWGVLFSGALNSLNRNHAFLDWCCFQFLKFIPFRNCTIFLECVFHCFSLGFMFHFPWVQLRTVTISRNSLVLYIAFFCFKFFDLLAERFSEVLMHFFLGSVYFVWGPRRFSVEIVLYNPFSWHLLLWFLCFCWGSETLSELHFCFALLELLPVSEPLQAITVFTKRTCFWRLVSWRFLVCVKFEIFQLRAYIFFLKFLLHY